MSSKQNDGAIRWADARGKRLQKGTESADAGIGDRDRGWTASGNDCLSALVENVLLEKAGYAAVTGTNDIS